MSMQRDAETLCHFLEAAPTMSDRNDIAGAAAVRLERLPIHPAGALIEDEALR